MTRASLCAPISDAPAYAGLKVIDASQGLAGPGAGLLLAQHGAEVIKVEPPEGDWARRRGGAVVQARNADSS